MDSVNYGSLNVPDQYECSVCKVRGCKLWRQYQTFADHIKLMCCDCAGKDQKKDVSDIDAKGKVRASLGSEQRIDQIGWMVPAVPTEDGTTFWGYTSVPVGGCDWWYRLPTRISATA